MRPAKSGYESESSKGSLARHSTLEAGVSKEVCV